jgi:hypothetical protein
MKMRNKSNDLCEGGVPQALPLGRGEGAGRDGDQSVFPLFVTVNGNPEGHSEASYMFLYSYNTIDFSVLLLLLR